MVIKLTTAALLLFLLELIYLKIAVKKNIKDNPNHRSSHKHPTVRGGGIIIPLAVIIFAILYQPIAFKFYLFLTGIILVSVISFIDDLIMLSSKLRIFIHAFALTLSFYALGIFDITSFYGLFFLMIAFIASIGFLNIYNFMDGINGITFLNGVVTLVTLLYLNSYYISYANFNLLVILIISLSVFGFFNFRKNAACFAGDIGSITMGFILIYLVLKFYIVTNNIFILLIFAVYLLDGGWTIIERMLKKENIFEAHKSHLYQIMANDLKLAHLKVSSIYFIAQAIINCIVILLITNNINSYLLFASMFVGLSLIYIITKKLMLQKIQSHT